MRIFNIALGAVAAAVMGLGFAAPAGAQTMAREVIVGTPGFTNNGGLDIITKQPTLRPELAHFKLWHTIRRQLRIAAADAKR